MKIFVGNRHRAIEVVRSKKQFQKRRHLMAEGKSGELGKFQKYLVEEFYDDYREGSISRRTFIRRVAFITGSMAAAGTAMLAVGCQPIEVPAATEPIPEAETPTAEAQAEAEAGAV